MTNNDRSKLYWFAQYAPPSVLARGRRDVLANPSDSLHMLRDGYAALYVSMMLKDSYDFGEILLNPPAKAYPHKPPQIGAEYFKSTDLVLMTTRPAMHQDPRSARRPLHRSGSSLEKTVLQNLEQVFQWCSRGCIILGDTVAERIVDPQKTFHRAIKFHVRNDAFYTSYADVGCVDDLPEKTVSEEATIGYLVCLPHLCLKGDGIGPRLLLIFGLNGTATLVWSHLLCKHYGLLLQGVATDSDTRLVMVKFSPRIKRGRLPATVGEVEVVDHEILIDIRNF